VLEALGDGLADHGVAAPTVQFAAGAVQRRRRRRRRRLGPAGRGRRRRVAAD